MATTVPTETTSDRAAAVQQVLTATAGESTDVRTEAIKVLQPPIPAPTRTAADTVWIILVIGLVVLLVLSVLGLMHVYGHSIADDKLVTIFTTTLAGLLGLFAKGPGQ
jgi:hypothetical protein